VLRAQPATHTLERRTLLKSAALSLLVAPACARPPDEKIIPYVDRPPEVVPGRPTTYATSIEKRGYPLGILAQCYEGRPTKLEGHPDHPANRGALGPQEQALLHQLYDPERSSQVLHKGHAQNWTHFLTHWNEVIESQLGRDGQGLFILIEPTTSLTMKDALSHVQRKYPQARFFVDQLRAPQPRLLASKQAFSAPLDCMYDLKNAEVILCLDDNLFVDDPQALHLAAQLGEKCGLDPLKKRSRLYVVEPSLTPTGMLADDRVAVPSSAVAGLASQLFDAIRRHPSASGRRPTPALAIESPQTEEQRFMNLVAAELLRKKGAALVTVGAHQPADVHLLVHGINELLDAAQLIAKAPTPLIHEQVNQWTCESGEELVHELSRGNVHCLIVLADNPLFTWPESKSWQNAYQKIPHTIHSALYRNETSASSTWHLPRAHELETFDCYQTQDGSFCLAQPLIAPLTDGRSGAAVLNLISGIQGRGRGVLERTLRNQAEYFGDVDSGLRRGTLPGRKLTEQQVSLDWGVVEGAAERLATAGAPATGRTVSDDSEALFALELIFRNDAHIDDGRFANSALLQELPDAVTKVVWDNTLLVHPSTAERFGLSEDRLAMVKTVATTLTLPVAIDGSQAPNSLSVSIGYGRRSEAETTARNVGFDVSSARRWQSPWAASVTALSSTKESFSLVRTQTEFSDHRSTPVALSPTLNEYQQDPTIASRHKKPPASILEEKSGSKHQWGMSIDLGRCSGCNACVIACQVENSIPTVGREQASLGRTMHWLRIDRYVKTRSKKQVNVCQPMACQHCEKAPCEYVCPVGATVHSPDGLNEMVYNRCVGTRYCSNNCPYKVRRFNFLAHDEGLPHTRQMEKNPNVTVRSRGVMEKCTYCVQRIRRAEIDARIAGAKRSDAVVMTACQQTCPTKAIVFGLISDERSLVSQTSTSERAYAALNEVGAQPRTRYLARVDAPLNAGTPQPRGSAKSKNDDHHPQKGDDDDRQ